MSRIVIYGRGKTGNSLLSLLRRKGFSPLVYTDEEGLTSPDNQPSCCTSTGSSAALNSARLADRSKSSACVHADNGSSHVCNGSSLVANGSSQVGNGSAPSKAHANSVELQHAPFGNPFLQDDLILPCPGIPPFARGFSLAAKAGAQVTCELDFCLPFCQAKVVSVTGTNGKTTLCQMIHSVLSACGTSHLLGNGGVPFAERADLTLPQDFVVLESSSFQLSRIKRFAPFVSIVTNVDTDHLSYHGSQTAYADAKSRNFLFQSPTDFALFNADDDGAKALAAKCPSQVLYYSLVNPSANCYFNGSSVIVSALGTSQSLPCTWLSGHYLHNRSNFLAAILACTLCGVPLSFTLSTLSRFTFAPHRLQNLGTISGVTFVDDSKATNVHAAASALGCFSPPLAVIFGGSSKGEDYRRLFTSLPQGKVVVCAFGNTAKQIAGCGRSFGVAVELFDTLSQCVTYAYGKLLTFGGGVLLMSNACPSFDFFHDYAHRGDQFALCVANLAKQAGAPLDDFPANPIPHEKV